jgi:hypothetical protein
VRPLCTCHAAEAWGIASLYRSELGGSLDVDDGAGNAGLAVAQGELAGDALGGEGASCITLRIPRALNEELAVEDDRVRAVA